MSGISDRPGLGCQKGACMAAATRMATYKRDDGRNIPMRSCDKHGGEPSMELPDAAAARRWNKKNAYWVDP